MNLYTMGFTRKTAEQFFGIIEAHGIRTLVDVRLNNSTQLAGFTKGDDLRFFLSRLCSCRYEHERNYAPSRELLDSYRHKRITWSDYEREYRSLIQERDAVRDFYSRFGRRKALCLLCSEPEPERCHRRLFAEMIAGAYPNVRVLHV